MSDTDTLERILSELRAMNTATGAPTGTNSNKSITELASQLRDLSKAAAASKQPLNKLGDSLSVAGNSLEVLRKEVQAGTKTQAELNAAQDVFASQVNDFTKSATLNQLGKQVGTATKALGAGFGNMAQAGGKVASDLLGSGSDIGAATRLMGTGLDIASSAGASAGAAITGLGATVAMVNPVIGGMVAGLGTVVSFVTANMSKLAQTGLSILSGEMEKTINMFNTASKSGALFTNGMEGMKNAAAAAGVTTEEFSQAVSANSAKIAEMGVGVGGGFDLIGRAVAAGDADLRSRFRRLGFGIQEQVEMYATVASNFRKIPDQPPLVPEELNRLTEQYAKNLRIISAVTGQDAKAKVAEAEASSNYLAFNLMMAKFPDQAATISQSLGVFGKQMQDDIRDAATHQGAITGKTGSQLAATVPGYADFVKSVSGLISTGELTFAKASEMSSEFSSKFTQFIATSPLAKTIGTATNPSYGRASQADELSRAFNSLLKAPTFTKESVAAANAAATKQAEAGNELTDKVVAIINATQKMRISIEKEILESGVLTKFASTVASATTSIQEAISAFTGKKAPAVMSPKLTQDVSSMQEQFAAEAARVAAGGAPRPFVPTMPANTATLKGMPAPGAAYDVSNLPASAAPGSTTAPITSATGGQPATVDSMKQIVDKLTEQNAILTTQLEISRSVASKVDDANRINKDIRSLTR